MVRNELCIAIPSYFKCPISMEVMKSPVSLSTGVTYDRSSIQRWLETGHTTCPATMQTLSSPSYVPNLTLLRLIHLWPSLSLPSPRNCRSINNGALHEPEHVILRNLVGEVTSSDELFRVSDCLTKVSVEAKKSKEYCRVLEKCEGLLDNIMRLIMLFDGNNIECLEIMLVFLDLVVSEDNLVIMYKKMIDCLPKFVFVIQNGSLEGKIVTISVLRKIVKNDVERKSVMVMIESPKLVLGAYDLVKSDDNLAVEAGLGLLIALAEDSRPLIKELVRLGMVKRVGEIFNDVGRVGNKAVMSLRLMEVLEMVAMIREGREAICEEEKVVEEVVKRLMKVSEKVTEHGVTVLWSVCYKFRDEKVVEVVRRCNGVGKCLLLLQSNCKGVVKSMCGDLVKVLRGNGMSNLVSYNTKTTHIMAY